MSQALWPPVTWEHTTVTPAQPGLSGRHVQNSELLWGTNSSSRGSFTCHLGLLDGRLMVRPGTRALALKQRTPGNVCPRPGCCGCHPPTACRLESDCLAPPRLSLSSPDSSLPSKTPHLRSSCMPGPEALSAQNGSPREPRYS